MTQAGVTSSRYWQPWATPKRPLLIRDARVLTLSGGGRPRRGGAMRELSVLPHGDVLIAGGLIQAVGAGVSSPDAEVIDAAGRVLMPGFVDAHTHACWSGGATHRLDEWEFKLQGTPYLDILARGGGIMASVRTVRAASRADLTSELLDRLTLLLRNGTTTVEVKSGYGLSTDSELKMLGAITDAARAFRGTIVPTALLGHATDDAAPGGREGFIDETIRHTLPQVTAHYPGLAIDAYCERGAWTLEECERLLAAAQLNGHPVRVHADQFSSLGMVDLAIARNALSVDHLEATPSHDLARLAASRTMGVLLPACGLHLDGRYANGRALIDAGGAVCVASNLNPGSAPCYNMAMVLALAVRGCGLTAAEAITASTINPAVLLGFGDRGTIEAGKRADLLLLRHRDERALAFCLGDQPIELVICGGQVVPEPPPMAAVPGRE